MKKILFIFLLFCSLSFSSSAASQDMRGVWVSSVFNLDFPSSPGLTSSQLSKEINHIVEKAYACGLTDIFLQVRPCCDSLYKSEFFPSSSYVCPTQGAPFPDDFDILEYFIAKGKENNINIHAWINPYRITKGQFASREQAFSSLCTGNPAIALKDDVVFHSDGNLYFDPSSEQVRQLIFDGIMEIVRNYDIAGIHLDDYFYPSQDFNDEKSYESNKLENDDLHSFRTRQVDILIYMLYDGIKSEKNDCLFGISPFGVWANKNSDPRGSDTDASQSYYDHYADTLKWVKEEKIDYIMPQLYWNIGNEHADYETLLNWWNDAVSGTAVKLYTGLSAYRISDNELGYTPDEIENQISLNIASENCSGFCIFRFNSINKTLQNILAGYSDTTSIYIATEYDSFQTTLPRYHIYGKSPGVLFMNDKVIETSSSGYFSVSVPLMYGSNSFTFVSGNNIRTLNIYRNYTPAHTISRHTFIKTYEDERITALFTCCKTNGSLYGIFNPDDITKEYFNSTIFSVSISKNHSNVYKTPSADEGAVALLDKDTKWNIIAENGDFFLIEDLGWINKSNCNINQNPVNPVAVINRFHAFDNEEEFVLRIGHSKDTSMAISQNDNSYSLHISGLLDIPSPPDNIKNACTIVNSSGLVYTFTPTENNVFSGYNLYSSSGYTEVVLRKKALVENNDLPLSGISFLIDAGHGGNSTGALSCDPCITEKDTNIEYASALGEKLSSLGASVEYTRTDDSDLTLEERYEKAVSTDAVFISIHSDSIPVSSLPISQTGISLHANNHHSSVLVDFIADNMKDIPITYTCRNSNLYMAKPKNNYSILLENQFVCLPDSLELLLSDEYKNKFIESFSTVLCDFFAK